MAVTTFGHGHYKLTASGDEIPGITNVNRVILVNDGGGSFDIGTYLTVTPGASGPILWGHLTAADPAAFESVVCDTLADGVRIKDLTITSQAAMVDAYVLVLTE